MIKETKLLKELPLVSCEWHKSKMGYEFDFNSDRWQLDGSILINLGTLKSLEESTLIGFRMSLCRYAEELSAGTTKNILSCFRAYCNATGEKSVNLRGLTNWRAMLTGEKEAQLGALKSFLFCWYDWKFPGIEKDCVDYLESLILKGALKGKAVKGACPFSGPLSQLEQGALIDWVANAFSNKLITLEQYSLLLTLSFTGRRMVQIRSCRVCDLISEKEGKLASSYSIYIPRVKQKDSGFRNSFRSIKIVPDLYMVLVNQCNESQKYIERHIGQKLPDYIKQQVPIFIDKQRVDKLESLQQLSLELESRPDYFHMTEREALDELSKVSRLCTARSERTGEFIHITSRRFRYSKGTNLARKGILGAELAYALDHSDIQHVTVYAENTPETAGIIDKHMTPALAPLAQAFAGTLIDSERDALRANDPHSRIKNIHSNNIGNCGNHGFCASGYRACYTCTSFQPWRDAPHEEVRDEILAERSRQNEIGVSNYVIQSTDRLLLAVEQVIMMCKEAKG